MFSKNIKAFGTILYPILLMASIARADILDDLKVANPEASPFEILEQLYVTAQAPADLADFDLWKEPSNMACAGADRDYMQAFRHGHIPKQYFHTIPSTPGAGPLFPGEPEKKVAKIITLDPNDSSFFSELVQVVSEAQILTKTSTDLVMTINSLPSKYDQSRLPVILEFRKNGKYIVYKQIEKEHLMYSYCWRQ